MKTKPVLIVVAILAVAVCGFFLDSCKTVNQPEKGELMAFLKTFNSMLEGGQTDVALSFFEKFWKNFSKSVFGVPKPRNRISLPRVANRLAS